MSQLILNIVSSTCLILLVALACHISYLPTRSLNFSLAGLITVGAYISYLLINDFNSSLLLALILGVVASSLIGLGLDITIFGRFRRNKVTGWMPFVVSIGLYVIIQNLISMHFGDAYKSLNVWAIDVGYQIEGGFVTPAQLVTASVSVSLAIASFLVVRLTQVGRAFAGVSSNPELCCILGINAEQVVVWSVMVASAIGAVAGILAGLDTNIFPSMGFRLLMSGIIVMVIAGIGSTGGLVGGSLLLATSQNVAAYYWDSKWMDAVSFLILITFLIWKPLGFSGRRLKKIEI